MPPNGILITLLLKIWEGKQETMFVVITGLDHNIGHSSQLAGLIPSP